MKRRFYLAALCFLIMNNGWAHGSVETVIPADGVVLELAPKAIQYAFDEPIQLTRVKIARIDTPIPDKPTTVIEQEAKITGSVQSIAQDLQQVGGDAVALDLTGQSGMKKRFLFPIDALTSGSYELTLRGLGEDGHAIKKVTTFFLK